MATASGAWSGERRADRHHEQADAAGQGHHRQHLGGDEELPGDEASETQADQQRRTALGDHQLVEAGHDQRKCHQHPDDEVGLGQVHHDER